MLFRSERAGGNHDLPLATQRSAGTGSVCLALSGLWKDLSPSTQDHSTATASLRHLPGASARVAAAPSWCHDARGSDSPPTGAACHLSPTAGARVGAAHGTSASSALSRLLPRPLAGARTAWSKPGGHDHLISWSPIFEPVKTEAFGHRDTAAMRFV